MKVDKKVYWKLFTSTFYLSAFTFGGAYVSFPLMKKEFVDVLGWLEEEEMLNMAAIAQSSSGGVAVNASILLGYRMAGVLGAAVTILGTVLPPLLIISLISLCYVAFRENVIVNAVLKGMQAGVAAVIADVVFTLGKGIVKEHNVVSVLVMAGAFAATFFFGVNTIFIILACGCIGALRTLWKTHHHAKTKKVLAK